MFRRRTATEAAPTDASADSAEKLEGKGRPTPKRRDAEQARKARVAAPKDRREALKVQRDKSRGERLKVQQAMQTGDERYLPARDKGPIRKFARDYVDARRTLAEFLLPFFLVILVLMMVQNAIARQISLFLWLAAIIIVPIDLVFLGFRFRRELKRRFPEESHRGATAYAIMRSTQIRRLRLPKPQVKVGETV